MDPDCRSRRNPVHPRQRLPLGITLAVLVLGVCRPCVGQTTSPTDVDGVFTEPKVLGRAISFGARVAGSTDAGDVKSGFYPELSNMITGAGWISAGPGYRHWLFGDRLFVDGSAAVSWRTYKMAQARIEIADLARSRLAVGSQVRWQDLTQVTYFGEGRDSLDADRSEYRLQSTNAVAYTTLRPTRQIAVTARLGWLDGPSVDPPAGSFRRGNPATQVVFPADPVFARVRQPDFAHREVSLSMDTRNARSHPRSGGLYRVAWADYTDLDGGTFSFRRAEFEAAQFVPVAGSRVVLAGHAWLAASQTDDGDVVPFYMLPSLGGNNTLRAYTDYRFHDRNLLVVNAEGRIALFTHVDAALFIDAGNVAPRVADLDLGKRAVGFGFRLHARQATFARIDVAHGDEGWRLVFRTNDPLHLSRLGRRTAAVPFAP